MDADDVEKAALVLRSAIARLPAAERPAAAQRAAELVDEAISVKDAYDERVVFAIAKRPRPGGGGDQPMVIFGIPTGAWRHIRTGRTVHFDLSKAGLDVSCVIFGGSDHASVQTDLEAAARMAGTVLVDRRRDNFGIEGAE